MLALLVRLDYAAVYVSLNAKSGEPEGLPDLARAAYWPGLPAVKEDLGKNLRKEQTFSSGTEAAHIGANRRSMMTGA
jgi:hypothetical protein